MKSLLKSLCLYHPSDAQDGTKVLTASCDKTCKVWDLQANQAYAFAQHASPVKCVRFVQSPHYQLAITGSWDKTLKVGGMEGKERR